MGNKIDTVFGSAVQAGSISVHYHESDRASRVPVPRQVPALEGPFVNRRKEVKRLDGLLEPREVGVAPVAVISGPRGVGKTSIGRYWAHANGERFTGGQLHADFDDLRQGGGVDVTALLGSFLRALGFDDEVIPETLRERSALFISKASEERILLLLDNVDQVAHVKPLVPGPSGSVMLITSRSSLQELVGWGAAPIELEPLDDRDAAKVLRRAANDSARLEAEPDAVDELIRVCAGLPIALRICGSLLAREVHRPISWLAGHLSDESARLSRMALEPEASVEAVFTAAYSGLDRKTRLFYRRLGLHPGSSFTPYVAAAAAEISVDEANELLGELRRANLIEGSGERFNFHDLLRIHAKQIAEADEPEDVREETLRRIVDFYVESSQRIDRAIIPVRLRLSDPPPEPPRHPGPSLGSTAEAMCWFDDERANLLAVLRAASAREWDSSVWRVGEALWLPYHNRKYFGEAIEVYSLAAAAAHRVDDKSAEARLRAQLARAYLDLEDHNGAEAELKRATCLAEQSGHRELRASVVEFNGVMEAARENYADAITAFEGARAAFEELKSRRGVAIQEYHLGRVLNLDGQHKRAIERLSRAVELIDADTDGLTLGRVFLHMGEAQWAVGDREAAISSLRSAITIMRSQGAPFYEALARERLAKVKRELGEDAEAREHLERALEVYAGLQSPKADEVRSALAEVGKSHQSSP